MTLTLFALALAPGLAIMLFIYFMDRHEKEPLRLLALSFFYGLLSVGLTLLLSGAFGKILPQYENIIVREAIRAFLGVALVEEFSKFIFLILFLYPHKEFNEPFDGIVYAVMISMGFATLENILYVADGGLGVALLRMFTAVPAHATFAVMMGYFAGSAKFKQRHMAYSLIGLLVATLFHGFYDFFLFISHIPFIALLTLISLITGIVLSSRAIRRHSDASPFRIRKWKRFRKR
ncbi:MAG: PrsW family glutamic-type intramembrane protease [Cyclobacteriaceae bacterium]|nr:PrsW family glutamic-type intramembrane protease [Cyclobacteriaceae bacterium]